MISSFFVMLSSLISPLVTLLSGYLLTQVEDLLDLLNVLPKDKPVLPDKKKTIKLIKLIGMLMVIGGGLKLIGVVFRFIADIFNFFGAMF